MKKASFVESIIKMGYANKETAQIYVTRFPKLDYFCNDIVHASRWCFNLTVYHDPVIADRMTPNA